MNWSQIGIQTNLIRFRKNIIESLIEVIISNLVYCVTKFCILIFSLIYIFTYILIYIEIIYCKA